MRNLFKKGTSAVIALSMAASMAVMIPITASADDILTFTVANGKATITGLTDAAYTGTVTIPATVNYEGTDVPVTSIGKSFRGKKITGLDLLNATNLTELDNMAFQNCPITGTVVIPANITSIGALTFGGTKITEFTVKGAPTLDPRTFESCTTLTTVDLGNVTKVPDSTFLSKPDLTSVTMNKVTSVGVKAFRDCPSLSTVTMPAVKTIGEEAFLRCTSLTGTISLPNATTFNAKSFRGCKINKVVLGANVSYIDNSAFYDNPDLVLEMPTSNSYYSVQDGILYNGDKTTLVICYAGVTGDVYVPDGVTELGVGAFFRAYNVETISLPESLATIAATSFTNCTKLKKITVRGDNNNFKSTEDGLLISYEKDEDGNVVGQKLEKVPNAAESVVIPEEVTSIAANSVTADTSTNITYNGTSSAVVAGAANGTGTVTATNASAAVTMENIANENNANKPAFISDEGGLGEDGDGGATGFVTRFENKASNDVTYTKVNWSVTGKNETKAFTRDLGNGFTISGSGEIQFVLIITGLYDADATVVTTVE